MTAQLRMRSVSIIVLVVLLDRITKLWIRKSVSLMDVNPVISGFFNIVHTENPGAAFGFLSQSQGPWRSLRNPDPKCRTQASDRIGLLPEAPRRVNPLFRSSIRVQPRNPCATEGGY